MAPRAVGVVASVDATRGGDEASKTARACRRLAAGACRGARGQLAGAGRGALSSPVMAAASSRWNEEHA